MICENPYTQHGARAFPCGSCFPCLKKRNHIWKTRLALEALNHPHTAFITLTYRPEELPKTPDGLPTLIPSDLSLWLKRLRIDCQRKLRLNSSIRFYAAGEYGEKSELPHYHAILFSYPGCAYGISRYRDGRTLDCCAQCDLVRDTWGKGIVENQRASLGSYGYIAGYVMKKMTSKHDKRLEGRHPEFSRMSLQNGGIGINAVPGIATTSARRMSDGVQNDVDSLVRIDGKVMPIGKYLRQQIRKHLGGDGSAPPSVIKQMEAEMLPLLYAASLDHKEGSTLKSEIKKRAAAQIAQMKALHDIHNSRGKI